VHVVPGRHTIAIGDTPGARIDGLVDAGAEGNGNCDAITSVPTATWKVIPLCAGVTVIVPCLTLGGADGVVGGLGRTGEDGGVCGAEEDADEVGRPEAEPAEPAEPEEPEAPEGPLPPGTPEAEPEAEPEAVPVPAP
jgi:hypothetical protein